MWLQLLLCAQLLRFFICSIVQTNHFVMDKHCGIVRNYSDAVDYFKKLSFYNKPIKKPKVERLKNIDQLAEVPLAELSAIKKKSSV